MAQMHTMGPRRDGLDTPRAALFSAQATASEPTYAVARSGRGVVYEIRSPSAMPDCWLR